MSTIIVQKQKQPVIKNSILEKIPQNNLPIVHVLTSRTDNNDEKVRLFFNYLSIFLYFNFIYLFRKMNHFNSRR
jgi:hypothetical protein